MAISWENIRALAIFFGPVLLPKAISYYRSLRSSARAQAQTRQITPISPRLGFSLTLLASLVVAYLLRTLPLFAPENIFTLTQSRLQIPVDVLFKRLAALRGNPDNLLTARDEALRAKFVNAESRLLYFAVGPQTLADCPFCTADEPTYYFLYALPGLLQTHLVNAVAVALATSTTMTGTSGSQWRTLATIGAAVFCALDTYLLFSVDYKANARALRLQDLTFHHWNQIIYRYVGLALLDAALAWVLYLSCTNRAFVTPPSPAERINEVGKGLAAVKSKLNAMSIVKNTTSRDQDLRSKSHTYWNQEVKLMTGVMEEREVMEGVNDALANRINVQNITRDADTYAASLLQGLTSSNDDG